MLLQVLIFGSFTEDETRLFQRRLAESNLCPLEKAGLQCKSLDFASPDSSECLVAEPKQTDSFGRSKDIQGSKLVASDKKTKNEKTKTSNNFKRDMEAQANGGCNPCFSGIDGAIENESDTLDLVSLQISENESADTESLSSPNLHKDGTQTPKCKSMLDDCSAVVNPVVDVPKTLSEKAPLAKQIFPRGLINSGNLCFLNATLQALLSCSPFVQLLQDLRNQGIPKVLIIHNTTYMIFFLFLVFSLDPYLDHLLLFRLAIQH